MKNAINREDLEMQKLIRSRNILSLVLALVGWAVCGACYADTIVSLFPGAGFQTWTAADVNNNMSPYWDYPTNYSFGPLNNGNVGFCLTTGCAGQLSPGPAPGAIPFWGQSYNSTTDFGGSLDPNFFFKSTGAETLKVTLEVSLATSPAEKNNFGWVETDSIGNVIGHPQQLFSSSDVPGAVATFQPTDFYAYYFQDVSESMGTLTGCEVFTVSSFNTDPCSASGEFHDMAAFATNPNSPSTPFWIAGLDAPTECTPGDGADCNLTLVDVEPAAVPEPTAALLLATGCAALFFAKGRRRRRECACLG
ncbi:MAG: PEP-CTERM sorting domain-containing protein [Candidatus Sulfotelmatobacter sp.]